ncbi:MAG: valine--tRNA ligase [Cellulosilyticaceae bacterium]
MEKHYDALRIEKEMQQLWKENHIYTYDSNSQKETYAIDTPPPTVSGQLHMGHIFSYTQAEIIARFKRMQGYNVFYPFGFDDNGLPTERLVEKTCHVRARDLSRSEMTSKCKEVAQKYEEDFKALWQSMGFSVDWELQYETVNPTTSRISQRLFLDLVKKGKAYSKEAPVLWCTECQTSIAQAELETVAQQTSFNYIPFAIGEEELIVATTRPELLYGVVALLIHPEDERYKHYIGQTAYTPVYGQEIPIIGEEEVERDKGTGIVMCATYGDLADTKWCEKHQLPYQKVILGNGRIDEAIAFVGGERVAQAREIMIEILKQQGLLRKQEILTHQVATHERCGRAVEIIPSKQWYIDILTDRQRYLQAADEINWYPEMMKKRYVSWVENLKWDWCISRQRYFGVPIPIWYCSACGEVILPQEEALPINPLEDQPKGRCTCGCKTFIPETAVMDTWATSSITPQINRKWQEADERLTLELPMGLRTQAHEIIRTWAFYTIVRSLYHTGKLPWKDIMISGFVLAKKGEKISKSKNNGKLAPEALIARYSADALRYWAAHAKLGTDTFFSEEELTPSKRLMNKLWNASKFVLMHLADFDGALLVEANKPKLLPIDHWIMARTNQTMIVASRLLDQYEIGLARNEIDTLFWQDFCDDYLEIVKDRLYKPEKHGIAQREAAQYTLYHVLMNLLKLYAIYIPHETEFIYQSFFRQHEETISLHQLAWQISEETDQKILAFGEAMKGAIGEIRKYKSTNNLSMKAPLSTFSISIKKAHQGAFEEEVEDIKACGVIEEILWEITE